MAERPPALNKPLRLLLERAPWVFIGSFGAVFSYNEHYLYARRCGERLEPGVVHLVKAYRAFDAIKAEVIEVDPANWLAETFGLPAWAPATPGPASPSADVDDRMKKKIYNWVDRLGPVSDVNIICVMLKSSGLEHDAW